MVQKNNKKKIKNCPKLSKGPILSKGVQNGCKKSFKWSKNVQMFSNMSNMVQIHQNCFTNLQELVWKQLGLQQLETTLNSK